MKWKKYLKYALLVVIVLFIVSGVVSRIPAFRQYGTSYDLEKTSTAAQTHSTLVLPEDKAQQLLELTNNERAKYGVLPLKLYAALNRSAQIKADTMFIENNYTHIANNGDDVTNYVKNETSDCVFVSENISSSDWPVEVIDSFMNSKLGHREALLDSRYDYVGFGISGGYTVQHFCDTP